MRGIPKRFGFLILCAALLLGALPERAEAQETEILSRGDYSYILEADGSACIVSYHGSDSHLIVPDEIKGHPVTAIGGRAFFFCASLQVVALPDSLTTIGDLAFGGCQSLSKFIVSPDHETFATIDGALYEKNTHTLVAYPAGLKATSFAVPEGTQVLGTGAFFYSTFEEIALPESLTTIGDSAFSYCLSLREIALPTNLTSIGENAFMRCASLLRFAVSPDHETFATADEALYEKNTHTLIAYPCGLKVTSFAVPEGTTAIGAGAFCACNLLEEVTLPESLTAIGDNAFSYCSSLKEIALPDSLTAIAGTAFNGCDSLLGFVVSPEHETFATIDGVLYEKNTHTLVAYPGGRQEISFTVPEGTTAIGAYAFSNCETIQQIALPEGVSEIRKYAFSNCSSLREIALSEGLTSIGKYAFSNCSSLEDVLLPEGLISIDEYAFLSCPLKKIALPEGLISIGRYAFSLCTLLQEVSLPESLSTIDGYAFSYCYGLKEITLPEGLTFIDENAFYSCRTLTLVVKQDSYAEQYAREFHLSYIYSAPDALPDGKMREKKGVPAESAV